MADQIALVAKQIGRKARLLDEPAFRREIAAINQKFAKRMKRSFERTTRTWSRDVRFQQLTEVRPDPAVAVYTTDAIYGYVSGGTRVRRALMSPDYDPKTKPGVLDSFPGRGHVVYVSRDLNLPGIEARDFPKLVEKQHGKAYRHEVERALQRAARKTR